MKNIKRIAALCLVITLFSACTTENNAVSESKEFKVDFTKFTLDNGLQVIFHIDKSDPVVAVALTSHVGSAREVEGRTGFAHLFEHLLFLESENLGKGGLDKMSARIGGSGANGSTSRDRTNYFQTVPKDALEKMIWAEADKLGYFINTVTEPVLSKEKQVVKNEKRQRVDNQPYGHMFSVINSNLYPKGHPYSWEVIGSLEDLQNATLQDVKDFFNRWYVPNNVTLTIAGDFDPNQAKEWVKKYFDEIPTGDPIPEMQKQQVKLEATKNLYYEDNFANQPQLTYAWPGVYQYHDDSYALDVLTQYLSQGKNAPLYKHLVEEDQLTNSVNLFQYNAEVAGQIMLSVTAFNQINLNTVANSIQKAFEQFEEQGISAEDLDRIKAGQETGFYNGLSSVQGKGFQLAQYEIFAGDPGYINDDINKMLAVTSEDVMRVYKTYIAGKHHVSTSFVPKGQSNLVLENAVAANVAEEKIIEGAEEEFDASIVATYEKTPSSFDRSIEPPYGESPVINMPTIWKEHMSSGIQVFGIENSEVPLVQFEIQFNGGQLLENPEKIGVANLLAGLMNKGTQSKSVKELETLIESLGARLNASASAESITLRGTTLSKNFKKIIELASEMLLEPRWDEMEFDLLKQSTLSQIQRQMSNPNSIATNEFAGVLFGKDHIFANSILGTNESINAITIEDLKSYYARNISTNQMNIRIVGSISKEEVVQNLDRLNEGLENKSVSIPEVKAPVSPETSQIYFYDMPGAKQSVIRFGYAGPLVADEDYYAATVMNYRLGGGSFASQLTQQLREGKGYTYGIGSGFSATSRRGVFTISSGVRSNVTYESTDLVKSILENYGKNFSQNDLDVTKGFTLKSNARAFESLGAKMGILRNISNYGFSEDYMSQREKLVQNMTIADVKKLAEKYIKPNNMYYIIVGDAETQMKKLSGLGFGDPILLNAKK